MQPIQVTAAVELCLVPEVACTCRQKMQITAKDWGRIGMRYCGRTAVVKDSHGRDLCLHHFNKWEKSLTKKYKKPVRP